MIDVGEINFKKKAVTEDVGVIVGLIVVQFLYAGNSILLSYLLKSGFQPSSLIIFSSFATFLMLSPLSIIFERNKWPKTWSYKLIVQLLLLGFGGVTVFQSLFMKGVSLTSPAMATAMPNIAPGIIFFIAWTFRLEKVDLGCRYSRGKIAGTLLCVVGAVVMSLMQSTVQDHAAKEANISFLSPLEDNFFDKQTIVGCTYLMAAVVILSSQVILQAATLQDFRAPVSLCAITSLLGVIFTTMVQIVEELKWHTGWPSLTLHQLIAYSILTGSVSGMCISFNAWAMKKRGPVMVSIFNPLATVISVIISVITSGESIGLGSVVGMSLMFTGLYFVLWAKEKEGYSIGDDKYSLEIEHDMEKPLLLS